MLVLTRKVGEKIVIGEDIIVTVLAMRGGQVRLGIEAPDAVRVRREELGEPVLTGAGDAPVRRPIPAARPIH